MKISIKLRVFSDRLFVSSHGRRRGGVHRWSDGEGVGNIGVGGNSAVVGGAGSTVGVSSTSKNKNRPSQHKYKSRKQFELKQS